MIRSSHVVTPGVVYHAELEGPLRPKERASEAEIAAMHENDPDPVPTAMERLWAQEAGRPYYRAPMEILPSLESAGRVGNVVPMKLTVARLEAGDRGSDLAHEVVRSTWNFWVATQDEKGVRSLSETARHFGIGVSTCRRRLNTYRMWAAEAHGIDVKGMDRCAALGRFASKGRRKAA